MAHGRTRHNRSFKPIMIDIAQGEPVQEEPQEEEEEEEEYEYIKEPRKRKEKRVKTVLDC